VLQQAGFTGAALDIALGISWWEADGPLAAGSPWNKNAAFADAVGDVSLINATWGPSIGLFQVRSLRDPTSGNYADTFRVASKLLDPAFNAQAAWEISKHGTYWSPWSVFNSGKYKDRLGQDYEVITGHPRASDWSK